MPGIAAGALWPVRRLVEGIARLEDEILSTTEAIAAIKHIDSMAGWLVEVLLKDARLARALGLPTAPPVSKAVLTLLRTESELRHPLTTLVAQRTAAFISTLREIYAHPLARDDVRTIAEHISVLEGLVEHYQLNYKHRKTVRAVAQALAGRRMHLLKVSPQEPDLRVALRAFYEDPSREDRAAVDALLGFALEELLAEAKRPGHIGQPRHAWWALFTVIKEASPDWIAAQAADVNRAAKQLLSRGEYVPGKDVDYTSVVPDLHSPENEQPWVAINALRILDSANSTVLRKPTSEAIALLANDTVNDLLLRPNAFSNLKLAQTRLLLLYEAANHRTLRYTLNVASKASFTLTPMKVGTAFFEAPVAAGVAELVAKVDVFVRSPRQWKRPTLTSVMISGAAGQGKSELALQLIAELRDSAIRAGVRFDAHMLAIGRDIESRQDLDERVLKIAALKEPLDVVRCFFVDEIDKASFDVFAPLLTVLEDSAGVPVTIWVFAQSKAPTFAELQAHADRLESKSMRDFLTRMLLGQLDLPHVKYSPEQKLCTLVGMAKNRDASVCQLERDLVVELLRRPDIRNSRDILRALTEACEVRDQCLYLKTEPHRRLADYPVRRPRNDRLNLKF